MNKLIGKRLSEVRKAIGLTQENFGKPIGLTRINVTNLESGKVQISTLHALAIEYVYKINSEWLLTGNGESLLSDNESCDSTDSSREQTKLPAVLFEDIQGYENEIDTIVGEGSFSERLRTLIKERLNISQTEFCEKLGLTPGYLSMIIKGKRGPSADLISGVYLHYRDHFHWLITGEYEHEIHTDHEVPYFDPVINEHIEIVKKFKHKEHAKKINESLLKIDSIETLERIDVLVKGMALGMRCEVTFVENSTSSNQNHFSEGNLKNGTEE
ncbi:helix-turn-helix transcriptional regulator [Desulforegula conservatrix]|uniref:helix-turn-helix transcriptional regulator n=1 Tax=Desulforegula conservatrix TaxID=153026 RepID=UPI00040D0FCF|nr:helix-turn-helix transcriptional regulator [Desulforegula conservatrix]